MLKRRIPILITVFCLLLSLSAPCASALSSPNITAGAAVIADLDTGVLLYEKSMDEKRSPASLTKIMTGLLAVEALERGDVNLLDKVTASGDCLRGLDEESSSIGIQPGETVTFQDLLYSALVYSACESCNIIAEYLEGSIDAFVTKMNTRAVEIGARNTHFADPHGLTDIINGHYTTAYDMYLITREAVSHPLFLKVCDTLHYTVEPTNLNPDTREFSSSNALITPYGYYGDKYIYEGASGVKTGYTRAAGYCLISTAKRDGINLIAVVMGCDGWLNAHIEEFRNFSDTIALYDWGFRNFEHKEIIAWNTVIDSVDVRYSREGEKLDLVAGDGVALLLPKELSENDFTIDVELDETLLVAPVEKGQVLGTARVLCAGKYYGSIDIVAANSVEMDSQQKMLQSLRSFFMSAQAKVAAAVIITALVVLFFIISVSRKVRRRKAERKAREEARRRDRIARDELRGKAVLGNDSRNSAPCGSGKASPESEDIDRLIESLGLDCDSRK